MEKPPVSLKGGMCMTTQMTENMLPVKRDYKSRLFTMIFNDKKELLTLYNAVTGKHYEDPELLSITTLENAIYMSMKNDISFIVDFRLSLYEHQSTVNPNMPLRFLLYLADLYSNLWVAEIYTVRKRFSYHPQSLLCFTMAYRKNRIIRF